MGVPAGRGEWFGDGDDDMGVSIGSFAGGCHAVTAPSPGPWRLWCGMVRSARLSAARSL